MLVKLLHFLEDKNLQLYFFLDTEVASLKQIVIGLKSVGGSEKRVINGYAMETVKKRCEGITTYLDAMSLLAELRHCPHGTVPSHFHAQHSTKATPSTQTSTTVNAPAPTPICTPSHSPHPPPCRKS
jgi:hypothetical protein